MKAIILAAGKGKRLGKLTRSIPKPMLKIENKPILEHNIEWLKNNGIKDIYINLHHLPDLIKDYFKDGKNWGVKIHYSYEPNLLGTAGGVRKIAEDFWIKTTQNSNKCCSNHESKNPFVVIYGDNLFKYDLKEIKNFHECKKAIATIALYKKNNVDQSGIVILDNEEKIIKFIEKPKSYEIVSHLVNTGLYILEPKVLNYIPPKTEVDFGKDVFPAIIHEKENIFGIICKGNLRAVDTPELYKQVITMN